MARVKPRAPQRDLVGGRFAHVRDMRHAMATCEEFIHAGKLRRTELSQRLGLAGRAVDSGELEPLAVEGAHQRLVGGAQAHCPLDHRIEHRREVAGRGVDNLQDLGSRGLLFQGLACLGQEARVFHRDDRLRREILQQRDLLVGKRPDLLAIAGDCAEQPAVLAQRQHEVGAHAAAPGDGAGGRSVEQRQIGIVNPADAVIQQLRSWRRG